VYAEVIDDGPGIPPDALPHVFEPFFTTKTVGTGRPRLSVSYGIVEEHGGHLGVESRPGRTVFRLGAAGRPVHGARRAGAGGARPMIVRAKAVRRSSWKMRRACSTHRDDLEPDRLARRRSPRAGARGSSACAPRYDLIVSDIRMPDGDGEEFYRDATQGDPSLNQRFIFIRVTPRTASVQVPPGGGRARSSRAVPARVLPRCGAPRDYLIDTVALTG